MDKEQEKVGGVVLRSLLTNDETEVRISQLCLGKIRQWTN
jgi:hypothetical protein